MALLKVKSQESTTQTPKENEKPKTDNLGRSYGTGRRKNAIARVWIQPGKGDFIVNDKKLEEYFRVESVYSRVLAPFDLVNMKGKFNVYCTAIGGGYSGQADAIRLGISRALDKFDPSLHSTLRKNKMLTRDARVVERKKYGKHKARKSTQFSKR